MNLMSQAAVNFYPNMLLRGAASHSRLSSGANPVMGEGRRKGEAMSEEQSQTLSGTLELDGHSEDVQLVGRAQAGDAKAFDALVLKHTQKLYGLVYHMTSNHDDTNDLLQDIWTKVYRSLAGFRGASRFTTWVHSIAVNMTINFVKRRARRRAVSIEERVSSESGDSGVEEATFVSPHTPRTEASLGELQRRLSEALEQLTPDHRAVVTMFDIQGMAHAEISKILGVSEGTIRSRLFYAHRQLQSYLGEFHTEQTDK
jgi:RNA polymerase sigma-70 factor (ECF subfamily)